jgi:hypothetical protein
MQDNVKTFFNGDETPNNSYITICEDTNDNVVWEGLYSEMPKTYNDMIVTSFDVCEMEDDTLSIGIIVE